MNKELHDEILRSLRRITRAIDLHSRKLATRFGLTGPQLVCLRVIAQRESTRPSELAREVSLSQATITGILDRLLNRQLITRDRSEQDRRQVTVKITDAGRALSLSAPHPLQERFVAELCKLSPDEQTGIAQTLERVVHMMDGEAIDAAPLLDASTAPITGELPSDEQSSGDSPADETP